jgi:hypothetical protein
MPTDKLDEPRPALYVRRARGTGGFGQEHTGAGLATNWAIIILA